MCLLQLIKSCYCFSSKCIMHCLYFMVIFYKVYYFNYHLALVFFFTVFMLDKKKKYFCITIIFNMNNLPIMENSVKINTCFVNESDITFGFIKLH